MRTWLTPVMVFVRVVARICLRPSVPNTSTSKAFGTFGRAKHADMNSRQRRPECTLSNDHRLGGDRVVTLLRKSIRRDGGNVLVAQHYPDATAR